MEKNRRNNSRTEAKGLQAKIMVTGANRKLLIADVNLLDVSQSGIKLRMTKPLMAEIGSDVQLEIILPESGLPVIVNAVIVHEKQDLEFGMRYVDLRPEDPIDQLISECGNRISWTA